jgi:hypothetical protein
MGKRGPKPKQLISSKWTSDLAYLVGLIATDGCLSRGRYVTLVSKDVENLSNFQKILGTRLTIGTTKSGSTGTMTPRVQLNNILFYELLISIGLTPAKSKTIRMLDVPDMYFFDFLRGVFDGDGSTYSYIDKRWRSSFMFYVQFASASPAFLKWLQETISRRLHVSGHTTKAKGHNTQQLKYAKRAGLILLRRMYSEKTAVCLTRKRLKIDKMLRIVGAKL